MRQRLFYFMLRSHLASMPRIHCANMSKEIYTSEEGSKEHCQCGAAALSNQRIFDWLDETLKSEF
jgi:hypothetical protein